MKDSFWFTHDANARNDPKISALMYKYEKGYQWYFMLIELMREQKDYKLRLNSEVTLFGYSRQIYVKDDEIEAFKSFIDDCTKSEDEEGFGLFKKDSKFFWSESLCKRMTHLDDVKKARQKAAHARWDKENGKSQVPSGDENIPSPQEHANKKGNRQVPSGEAKIPNTADANAELCNANKDKIVYNKENKKNKKINKQSDSAKRILEHLNEKRKEVGFKTGEKSVHNNTLGMLKEGYTEDEMKLIVDFKIFEWADSKDFRKYLCQETLFRKAHREKYVMQAQDWKEGKKHGKGLKDLKV